MTQSYSIYDNDSQFISLEIVCTVIYAYLRAASDQIKVAV